MTTHLAEFCHPVVAHNGVELLLSRYQMLMEDAQEAIPDLVFHVAEVIADEGNQQVAARAWAGVEPSGKGVDFSEQVFYWFEEGKIRRVVSLVDMTAYREQMRV